MVSVRSKWEPMVFCFENLLAELLKSWTIFMRGWLSVVRWENLWVWTSLSVWNLL